MARTKIQEEEPVEKVPSYILLRTKSLQEAFSMEEDSPLHHYPILWFVLLSVCVITFWIFLENFAYLSLTLNFWSHWILSMVIGWITRLVDQIGS